MRLFFQFFKNSPCKFALYFLPFFFCGSRSYCFFIFLRSYSIKFLVKLILNNSLSPSKFFQLAGKVSGSSLSNRISLCLQSVNLIRLVSIKPLLRKTNHHNMLGGCLKFCTTPLYGSLTHSLQSISFAFNFNHVIFLRYNISYSG